MNRSLSGQARSTDEISGLIGRRLGGRGKVPSFDPQPVFFVPVLDRQFGIANDLPGHRADRRAGRSLRNAEAARFALDSPLEEDGFELVVPLSKRMAIAAYGARSS